MRYSAFISYNHRDVRWAKWLLNTIERYRLPKALLGKESPLGPLARVLPPAFRDREELGASGDLAQSVQAALVQSSALIVICSPSAVASRWVNEEIRQFASLGRNQRIFCLIVDGEPHSRAQAGPNAELECFPPALLEVCAEPLAADVRPGMDGKQDAALKLIAGILAVDFDALRQREATRRHHRLAWVATACLLGFIIMSAIAAFAAISGNEAIEQRDIARQKTLTAERTVTFVKSLFEVADPSEAKGSTVTAREVLDRGAEKIERDLTNEPNVKAELATTLGEVYLALGLYRSGQKLIERTFVLPGLTPSTRVRQFLALADSQTRQGNYSDAIISYTSALRIANLEQADRRDLLPRILVGLGEAQSAEGEFGDADISIRRALAIDLKLFNPLHPDVARDLEALGLNAFYAGKFGEARPLYERALSIRLRSQGQNHPRVAENLNTLGAIAYLQRDSETAERFYRRALRSDALVLGPYHPDVAATLNNLARILLERQRFREARPYLKRALAINLKQRDDTHDDLAFTFANLAIVERGLGNADQAQKLFVRALGAAYKHKHRNLGPILVDLAALDCQAGRTDQGFARLDEAVSLIKSVYPQDPWRMAWAENTRAACLLAAGKPDQAKKYFDRSVPVLMERWPRGSLYASIAYRRQSQLHAHRAANKLRT